MLFKDIYVLSYGYHFDQWSIKVWVIVVDGFV